METYVAFLKILLEKLYFATWNCRQQEKTLLSLIIKKSFPAVISQDNFPEDEMETREIH